MKFRTVIELMTAMGFDRKSEEVRRMALLWLESVSGIGLTVEELRAEAKDIRFEYQQTVHRASDELNEALARRSLSEDQIRLLALAANNPEIIEIIRQIREFSKNLDCVNGNSVAGGSRETDIQVAED